MPYLTKPKQRFSDILTEMQRLEARLKRRKYPRLKVSGEVAKGENHFTMFHDVVTSGLILPLPAKGPYSSG